jgi:hypothetical protein
MESANSDTEPMCRATPNSTKKYEKLASATEMAALRSLDVWVSTHETLTGTRTDLLNAAFGRLNLHRLH